TRPRQHRGVAVAGHRDARRWTARQLAPRRRPRRPPVMSGAPTLRGAALVGILESQFSVVSTGQTVQGVRTKPCVAPTDSAYGRIAAALRVQIESGELPAGAVLPTEHDLAGQWG